MGNTSSKRHADAAAPPKSRKGIFARKTRLTSDVVANKDSSQKASSLPNEDPAINNSDPPLNPLPQKCVVPAESPVTNAHLQHSSQPKSDELFPIVDYAEAPYHGLPYNIFQLGPPQPPCDEQRIQTAQALKKLETPCDAEIDNILKLICNIMDSPAALVALFDDRTIFCRNSIGFKKGDFPWRWSFCAWTLQPPNHQTFIVEDVDQDARFKDNHVAKSLGVKFYCGSPLVASNGHRLGSLCFIDAKPRKMDACKAQILNNFSELVVRELEKDIELQLQKQKHEELQQVYGQLERAIDCLNNAVLFVDTSCRPWKILHCNQAWIQLSGLSRDDTSLLDMWELFLDEEGRPVHWDEFDKDLAASREFKVIGAYLRMGLSESPFILSFRPAGKDTLDAASVPIGVPNFTSQHQTSSFFFVTITEDTRTTNTKTCHSTNQPLDGLELGALLGCGVHGRVYFGRWYGTDVAVKVVEDAGTSFDDIKEEDSAQKASVEAALSAQLAHPNIVRTLFHCTLPTSGACGTTSTSSLGDSAWDSGPISDGLGSGGHSAWDSVQDMPVVSSNKGRTIWAVMEFCDRGTLQDAVDKGWLRTEVSMDAPPNFHAVVVTAHEIAAAMAYLHDRGIVHGDLSAYNVLLSSSGSSVNNAHRCFMAKVADFGLSRDLEVDAALVTRSYGTITHMPPELLLEGVLSKATDVYSFGVIMWEILTSSRPWGGLSHGQVMQVVTSGSQSLMFPVHTHPKYEALARRCMSHDPSCRPTFAEVGDELEDLLLEITGGKEEGGQEEEEEEKPHPNSGFFQSL